MSDTRKEIQIIDPSDPSIIPSVTSENDLEKEKDNDIKGSQDKDSQDKEAIDDDVIDGSNSLRIEEAEAQVKKMIEEAEKESEIIKKEAEKSGYDEGYSKGIKEGEAVIEKEKQQLVTEKNNMILEKESIIRQLEPKVANIIRELLIKLVGRYEDDPNIIVHLAQIGLNEIHTYGSFIIKVSIEDYDYIIAHKKELEQNLSEKVDIEILKDTSLEKNQCLIETEMGNIDSSLKIRLSSLSKELKLIGDSLKLSEHEEAV